MPPRSRSHSPATYPNSIPLTIPPQAKRKTALAEANFPIFFILIIGLISSILYQRYQSPGLISKTEVKEEAIMAELKVGDTIPEGTIFSYIPYTEEKGDITACGIPINYDASKEWANKRVVLFSVPGAFTPGCSARHLPGYISNLPALKSKGVDVVACIAYNDAFVMSAWGKANGIKGDDILFLSDPETKFSKSLGWTLGERTARYALIIENGKIVYAEKEPGRDVSVSSAEAVLAKL